LIAMPRLIPRAQALEEIVRDGGRPECLMCAIRDGRVGATHVVYEHAMVMPKVHVVSYVEVDPALWLEMCRLALVAARVIERVQRPQRCYVASTGSSAGEELIQTSRHLHMHVIPLYDPDDRPGDVFSWAEGVYVGEPDEWGALVRAYREAWGEVGSSMLTTGKSTSSGSVGS
jgi:diadenosine tetraphosphate (Ap4A) HIT family hydrolase